MSEKGGARAIHNFLVEISEPNCSALVLRAIFGTEDPRLCPAFPDDGEKTVTISSRYARPNFGSNNERNRSPD